MIIAGSWIFSPLFSIPLFLVTGFNKSTNTCAQIFPEKWMAIVNSWAWFLLPALSTALMAGLYSRVVYTLWFKKNVDGQLTFQQQVNAIRVESLDNLMSQKLRVYCIFLFFKYQKEMSKKK